MKTVSFIIVSLIFLSCNTDQGSIQFDRNAKSITASERYGIIFVQLSTRSKITKKDSTLAYLEYDEPLKTVDLKKMKFGRDSLKTYDQVLDKFEVRFSTVLKKLDGYRKSEKLLATFMESEVNQSQETFLVQENPDFLLLR